jgi:acyl-CoA synthetase (AMP-forming)/AMP-acid ligase II
MWRHEDLFFAALQGGNPGGEPITEAEALAPRMLENGDGLHIHPTPPLIHGNAQLASWIALLNGGVAVLVPGRRFDPERSLDLCESEAVHSLSIVGDAMALPIIDALERNPGRWDLRELNAIASAGAVLSANLLEQLEQLIPSAVVLNSFGASETGHQGTAFYENGKAVWFMDEEHTCVLDENLDPVQPGSGTVGMLARFGHIPLGYYEDEEKTAATFREKDGVRYVLPGDMATIDAEGNPVFLGRGSVCINTGGEKVYPEEVEEALKHHEQVLDAVVVGVPDDRWGQRVEALITVRSPPQVDAITDFCRTRIAGYKVPRTLWIVDDLNRQPSGKPDYRWARDRAIQLGEQP